MNNSNRILDSFLRLMNLNNFHHLTKVALVVSAPTVILGPILQAFGVTVFFPLEPLWPFSNSYLSKAFTFLDIIVFSPVIESAIVFLPAWLTSKVLRSLTTSAVVCALFWGAIHYSSTNSLVPGVLSLWPFFCMSYIALQSNAQNRTKTWLKISLIHSISNLIILFIINFYYPA